MRLSIIIPIKDQITLTRVCLDSLRKYTKDFELIIIDDGSDEEMTFYLQSFAKNIFNNIKIIRNEISIGYTKAVNQGLRIAGGDYIVVSNNDVVFTPDWATNMLYYFRINSKLGILSPVTNKVEGYQSIDYNTKDFEYCATDSLIFFCIMINRAVLNQIGFLDESFSPGGQEDADYCTRAKTVGWEIGIAREVFIYHYGSLSFRKKFNNDINTSREYADSRTAILVNKYKKKKVFIGIPNMGVIATALRDVLSVWEKDPKYDLRVYGPECLFPLDNARNTIVKEFLELDYEYLLWIDDDIVPPINALDELIKADKDAIGAACFSMKADNGKYFPYPVTLRYNEEKKYAVYYGKGIEEVDATGGACILVKRKVYEQLERPYEFVYHKDGTLALTCDFKIWKKWQELGGKLYINFNILCDHRKKCSIKGIQDMLNFIVNSKKEKEDNNYVKNR